MHLELKQETEVHFLVGEVILGFLSIFKKSQASSHLKHWILCASRGVKGMWFPLSRWPGYLRDSLESPKGNQTFLHHVIWKTRLNLSHFMEIRLSFESRPLMVHSTWDRKHSVPLTYLLLKENSTWGACGKVAHLFSQKQGIRSHLETIWGAWSFPRVLYRN